MASWVANADGSKSCEEHGTTFRAPVACAQCETSDAHDDTSTANESFPRTASALARAASHHLEMHKRFLAREEVAFEAANYTAGAAYGRLALSSLTAACERLEKIAERGDIDDLDRRRSRARKPASAGVQ